ncbi:MAG TPA: exodeoxyribonuclease VII large subunit, partial [Patescibacteria group bacterium]|nr:exodeoxyribonuclease VII large subunit [Patescibacteria group bacterium]
MQIMTVPEFVNYLNETFKAIWDPHDVAIEGEVSGYRVSQNQWASFDLKDAEALVNIFMPVWKVQVPLEDGMRVRVFGVPRIYPKYGKFSFNAERVELNGEGTLRKALAILRQKFEAEGLFDPSRKRPLPVFPARIALIASRESAAYGDFLRIVNERWNGVEIDVYHVIVQGDAAPESIVRAIGAAGKMHDSGRLYDAVVMTRGGGSLEELMAF